jgi:ATP/maltotriose-dependent transcriptional regulator MalT
VLVRLVRSSGPDVPEEEPEERRRMRQVAGRLLMRLTDAYIYAQQSLPVMWSGLRMLNLCEPAGDSPELARGYTNMAVVAGAIPVHMVARAWADRAQQVAERVGTPADLAYVLCRNAVYGTYVARWAEVEAWLRHAIALVESIGDLRLAEECRALLTVGYCYQGHYAKGLPLMEWMEGSARRRGALQTQHWALHYQAHIHLRLGERARARAALEATVAWTEAHGGVTDRIIVEGTRALLLLAEGDASGAREAARKALKMLSAGRPVAHFVYFGAMAVAEVLFTLWARQGAEDASLVAEARAARWVMDTFARSFPFGEPAAWLWRGSEAWLTGDSPAAYEAWRRCVREAEEKGTAFEEARAHFLLSRYLPEEDPARAGHLRRAVELFTGLGMRGELGREREGT